MDWRALLKKILGPNCGETESYLSKKLTKEEFLLLKHCLERLGMDYNCLFSFCEDARVYNDMEICASYKGFSSSEQFFTKEEIGVILKAEGLLNAAPADVHEELRSFCHF